MTNYIKNYLAHYQNYKVDLWNYEDGCVLMGAKQLYEATGDEVFKSFIFEYLSDFIQDNGAIHNYDTHEYNIDNINAGKVLTFAYDQTNDEKYLKAIKVLMGQLETHPRTKSGNFFHKQLYPNQIWLDGLYMAQPFYMDYETRFNGKNGYNDILNQFQNTKKYLYNAETGLYYHAYDENRSMFWADKENGCSKNYWLRSMGWYVMALVDVLDVMSKEIYEHYDIYRNLLKEAVDGLLRYQDSKTKLFYQVIDHPEVEGNYLETSGTAMIAYAIMKGVRMGVLNQEHYGLIGKEIFDSLTKEKLLADNEGNYHLTAICHVAGLGPEDKPHRDGSIEYYLSEAIVSDDSKGVGPWMMAMAERVKSCTTEEEKKQVLKTCQFN